jgi:L-threonylcarbamoyladenylate synthase
MQAGDRDIRIAAGTIREGGIVAFPTETYYGLAVDPFNEEALRKLFLLKGRPRLKPVLLLVADGKQLARVAVSVPAGAEKLMRHFWPGPLTLVLPARPGLSSYVTGNTGTVGVRISPHPVAGRLLAECAIPLTATSANMANGVPAVTAGEVRKIFGDRIDFVVDGGKAPGGPGSTLVGFSAGKMECIRKGRIPWGEIFEAAGIREGQ